VNEAGEHGVDASHLQDEVDNLADRLDDLQAKLDDRCSELQSAATAVTQFNVSTSFNTACKVIFIFGSARFCLTHEAGISSVFLTHLLSNSRCVTSAFFPFSKFFKSWHCSFL
jgi:hypothetical protein